MNSLSVSQRSPLIPGLPHFPIFPPPKASQDLCGTDGVVLVLSKPRPAKRLTGKSPMGCSRNLSSQQRLGERNNPLAWALFPGLQLWTDSSCFARSTVLGGQSLLVAKSMCQTASMALPGELPDKREAVGPQRRVVVGSGACAETTISHLGADPGFPSSMGYCDGPDPGSGFPCCAPEVLISSHSTSRGPQSCR